MKINKAIEILQRQKSDCTDFCLSDDPDVPDALQLGIDALQQVKYLHEQIRQGLIHTGILHATELLPGETKE